MNRGDYSLNEPYERETWPVLFALRASYLERGIKFIFDTDSAENISREATVGKLYYLERLGVLKYVPPKVDFVLDPPGGTEISTADWSSDYPRIVALELHEEKFKELYTEYTKTFNGKKAEDTPKNEEKIIVLLSKDDRLLSLIIDDKPTLIKKFNPDMQADAVVSFLINSRAGKAVSIYELKNTPGLRLTNITDVAEVLRKAGLKPLQGSFIKEWSKQSARIVTEAEMTRNEAEKIVQSMTAKNRNISLDSD